MNFRGKVNWSSVCGLTYVSPFEFVIITTACNLLAGCTLRLALETEKNDNTNSNVSFLFAFISRLLLCRVFSF